MGTYLSTPIVDKGEESGEALDCPAAPLAWGVVDMQGWRKSMEDAHVARTDIPVPPHLETDQDHYAKVFGVFDGHGGAEVARFVQLYLVDVLCRQPTWVNDIESDDPLASPVGQALIDSFHALDRMIDQPERRDELIRLRSQKPEPGEQRTSDHIPIPPPPPNPGEPAVVPQHPVEDSTLENEEEDQQADSIEMKEVSSQPKDAPDQTSANQGKETTKDPAVAESMDANDILSEEKVEEPKAGESPALNGHVGQVTDAQVSSAANGDTEIAGESKEQDSTPLTDQQVESINGNDNTLADAEDQEASATNIETSDPKEQEIPALDEENDKQPTAKANATTGTSTPDNDSNENEDSPEDDDSDAVVGEDEAIALDQDLMLDEPDASDGDIIIADGSNRKVSAMFQKILSLGGNSGQIAVNVDNGDSSGAPAAKGTQVASAPNDAPSRVIVPTVIQNGRQICNLPDHPIHAGCTAVAAVLIGRKLTVANAGDSRAVLCRAGGRVEALSFDHKPQQHRELDRITKAGGFVNQFGRVNGNLNLSRSVGDLKYKQVPGIHPSGQMITAEPDIVEVYLQSNDEFFIIGCDGIWDCLSNAQAVKYVRDRIDTMTPTQIGVEMLDEIISEEPRASQGIGGDNMTIMIIDLQPEKRSYRGECN